MMRLLFSLFLILIITNGCTSTPTGNLNGTTQFWSNCTNNNQDCDQNNQPENNQTHSFTIYRLVDQAEIEVNSIQAKEKYETELGTGNYIIKLSNNSPKTSAFEPILFNIQKNQTTTLDLNVYLNQ